MKSSVFYNENASYPAAWLRNLSAAGHIAKGEVDERSIKEIQPEDIKNATQFHAFAGIGIWSHALRLAEWPDDREVWTGSCPCQPFSTAPRGRSYGFDDSRHLWPTWFRLIRKCRPPVIFGEQIARAVSNGWLDAISRNLEEIDYAVGATVLCSSLRGFPRRPRLFFVAYTHGRSKCHMPVNAKMARLSETSRVAWQKQCHVHDLDADCNGHPSSLAKRRTAYGNAVNPEIAAQWIKLCSQVIIK